MIPFDFLIVGAGLAGSVLAEQLSSAGKRTLLIDKRNHVGGNVFDFRSDGLTVQKYGPHIFHTNSERVWKYLNKYTRFNNYVHRVMASVNGEYYYIPINLETAEKFFKRSFTPESLKEYFEEISIPVVKVENSRDVVVSKIGEDLYKAFIENYTKKQWGVGPEGLNPEVLRRLPVRFNRDTRYFSDPYQGIPVNGFTPMVEKMVAGVTEVRLNTSFEDVRDAVNYKNLIYTGPIDEYFNYKFGKLPYRTVRFEFETLDQEIFQPNSVVNYPNDQEYTRITEFKYFYQEKSGRTVICREYPGWDGIPSYPVPTDANRKLFLQYEAEAEKFENVYFAGRLGKYRYINMDQVVLESLQLSDLILKCK